MEKFNSNPSKTILTITVGFLVIFLLTKANWAMYVSLSVGLIGVFSTYLAKQIEWLWFGLAKVLGYIMPNIILTIVFYIFLFPIAILSRIFSKKDHLHLKNNTASVFVETNKRFDEQSFKNPW